MAAHDHITLERLFMGSNNNHILYHGHTVVVVYKEFSRSFENKILVLNNYTDISRELLVKAGESTRWHDTEMLVMHVYEVPEYDGNS